MSTDTTLNELPKQYDHASAQRRWYPFWEQQGYFHSEPDPTREPYTIVIPPPNVTGALHLGHALNNTLQDILIRMKRMQGFETLWLPGTDHAGIATQAVVERRLLEEEKLSRHDLGREGLVERIWKWKDAYEARIIGQLKQMGCSCDWSRLRFTLDDVCARAVRETFFQLFKEGKIYRGKRLVNWDTYLQTAVSDDEVFHEPVKGHFWHFRYPVVDPKPGEPTHITIATTRPETMLGDTAVAVHPDPAAALKQAENELRERLADAPAKEKPDIQKQIDEIERRRVEMLPRLEMLRDMVSSQTYLELPLTGRTIPLILDQWAKPELGTGCVKITPAHDQNDYEVWQRHNTSVECINILNPDGTLNDNVPKKYRGMTVKKAREAVVADMEQAGLYDPGTDCEDREIDLAHSDRSKTPIEPMLVDQWFIKMDELAQTAMDAVVDGRVKIIPERYAKGYIDWLSEKRDWPIGRQLWWGHRMPVWTLISSDVNDEGESDRLCKEEEKLKTLLEKWKAEGRVCVQLEESDQLCIRSEHTQADLDSMDELSRMMHMVDCRDTGQMFFRYDRCYYICVRSGEVEVERELDCFSFVKREQDVLDTWFSSALWPHSTLGWPDPPEDLKGCLQYYYPTSVLITNRDIISLWVARMVLMGLHNVGEIPFHEVYIHPKILDGYGEGMSKSKGNGVDPIDVMDKFGADALRFGMAHLTTETQDVRVPVEFECPHCTKPIEQTKKNRVLPRIECPHCKKPFSTQWAEKPEDKALPRGAVVSERFELARNFCNKLWNASRFALMNMEGFQPGAVADDELFVEDSWLLSRLATVTGQVTAALEEYRYSDAARTLYDFAWDEFCSFYVEMVKGRLQDEVQRMTAQRVLAHALDVLLRLLHPMIPFLTEDVWQRLGELAPERGVDEPRPAAESVMIAPWPECDPLRQDPEIEAQFARFQEVLRAVRDIRARQNVPPKTPVKFSVRCGRDVAELLEPMKPYFPAMAGATAVEFGPDAATPPLSATQTLSNIEVFVDLAGLIDPEAELVRNRQERERLTGFIAAKEKKLTNANFVERAPAEVVQKERDSLKDLQDQLAAVEEVIRRLGGARKAATIRSRLEKPQAVNKRREAASGLLIQFRSDQFFADGPDRGLGPIGDADLPQDVLHVLLDRLVADVQRVGDFLVRQAVGQLAEDFALALGQGDFDVSGQPWRGQRAGDAAQLLAGPGAFARGRGADGGNQGVARAALQQVAARAEGHRPGHVGRVVEGRKDHDRQVGLVQLDPAQRGQSIAVGHANVQQHNVHLVLQGELDGGRAGGHFANHLHFRVGQHGLQSATHHFVVVGDQQSDFVSHVFLPKIAKVVVCILPVVGLRFRRIMGVLADTAGLPPELVSGAYPSNHSRNSAGGEAPSGFLG